MKTLAILALALAACMPHVGRPISPQDASRSVYKVTVEIQLGAPDGTGSDDEDQPDPDDLKFAWTGTAWVVDHVGPHSYLMTAGHVCESGESMTMSTGFLGLGPKKTFPIQSVTYKFESADGGEITGARVLVDDDKVDLCVLAVAGDLGQAIPIAAADPKYADEGLYIGAPHGLWGAGTAGVYKMMFMGRGNPFKGHCNDDMPFCDTDELMFSSAEAAGGASGSPIIFKGLAVGVLNFGPRSFGTFIAGVPWEHMRHALAQAKHEEPLEAE